MIPGYTIDTAKLSTNAPSAFTVGHGSVLNGGVLVWSATGSISANKFFMYAGTTGGADALITQVSPFAYGASDAITFIAKVPIEGWAASNLISTQEALFSGARARYTAANAGAVPNVATIFDFPTKVYDDLGLVTTGASWKFTAPKTAKYRIRALVHTTGAVINAFTSAIRKNGVNYAVKGKPQEVAASFTTPSDIDTTILLNKGDFIDFTHDEAINGAVYSVSNTGQYIEIEELFDSTVFGVTGETELIEAKSGYVAWPITVGQYGDLTSVTLPTGEWDIHGQAVFLSNGATTTTLIGLAIIDTPGNTTSGNEGDTRVLGNKNTVSTSRDSFSVDRKGIIITASTIYYLKAFANTSITNLEIAYKISARRIK
jgi:hypothetical protein